MIARGNPSVIGLLRQLLRFIHLVSVGEHALAEEIERRHSGKRSLGDLSKADIKKR